MQPEDLLPSVIYPIVWPGPNHGVRKCRTACVRGKSGWATISVGENEASARRANARFSLSAFFALGVAPAKQRAENPHPPWASTTLRQGSESFGLFSRRHAFICGGLPINSAQKVPASERQAIFSCAVGPDCAIADELKAISRRSETYTDFFMIKPFDELMLGVRLSAANIVETKIAVHAMFMAVGKSFKSAGFQA
jgi:hypothetical protein